MGENEKEWPNWSYAAVTNLDYDCLWQQSRNWNE